jgi:hypothetical protein
VLPKKKPEERWKTIPRSPTFPWFIHTDNDSGAGRSFLALSEDFVPHRAVGS